MRAANRYNILLHLLVHGMPLSPKVCLETESRQGLGEYRVRIPSVITIVLAVVATIGAGTPAFAQFTDDPLTAGTAVKAVHITELRSVIANLRSAFGLPVHGSDAHPDYHGHSHSSPDRSPHGDQRGLRGGGATPPAYRIRRRPGSPSRPHIRSWDRDDERRPGARIVIKGEPDGRRGCRRAKCGGWATVFPWGGE